MSPNVIRDLQSHHHFPITSLEDWALLFIIFHPLALLLFLCLFVFMLIHLLCCVFFFPYSYRGFSKVFFLQHILLSNISRLIIVFAPVTSAMPCKVPSECASPANSALLNCRSVLAIAHWACLPHDLININQQIGKWLNSCSNTPEPSPILNSWWMSSHLLQVLDSTVSKAVLTDKYTPIQAGWEKSYQVIYIWGKYIN